jgi:hypothetical protein
VTVTVSSSTTAGTCGLQDSSNDVDAEAADVYTSGSNTLSSPTIDVSAANESAICAENSGTSVTVTSPAITSSSAGGNQNDSSFYGTDAAVLAYGASSSSASGATIIVTGGTIATTGQYGNGAFASGDGANVTLTGTTITATGGNAHGADAAYAGTLNLTNVTATTSGASSSVVATDRGGGTVTVSGGTFTSSGQRSAGVYSTGAITAVGSSFLAGNAEAVVVEGLNSVTLKNTTLTSSGGDDRGIFLYQSTSGDASSGTATFTMTSGSITYTCSATACSQGSASSGQNNPATMFSVANTTAIVNLTGVSVTNNVATLLTAAALNSGTWGTAGSNGGNITFNASGTTLTGNVIVDDISTAAIALSDSSSLSGEINNADTGESVSLTLDGTSTWTVTGTSYLTSLSGLVISGTAVSNITGNGHCAFYSGSVSSTGGASSSSATYTLSGGGYLAPAGTTGLTCD